MREQKPNRRGNAVLFFSIPKWDQKIDSSEFYKDVNDVKVPCAAHIVLYS